MMKNITKQNKDNESLELAATSSEIMLPKKSQHGSEIDVTVPDWDQTGSQEMIN